MTESDFVGALRLSFEKLEQLNRRYVILRRDLDFFLNDTTTPVKREPFLLSRVCFSRQIILEADSPTYHLKDPRKLKPERPPKVHQGHNSP